MIGIIKTLLGRNKTSGVKKVFVNLCKGFNVLKVNYDVNLPFEKIREGEVVVVLGEGKYALQGYRQPNPVIAGIGLMTHPSEWPELFAEYPMAKYLQHSRWAMDIYIPYYGIDKCELWPAGVDTQKWAPATQSPKKFDVLVYNKIMWNKPANNISVKEPILNKLKELGLSYTVITYGEYNEGEYFKLLTQCRSMIFLCEHESQGFACCEALSMNVPVFAWDQGLFLDPNRFVWNAPVIPATSVPFFDNRCGMRFREFEDFERQIGSFWDAVKRSDFKPRDYILENLTLEHSAQRMLDIIEDVYK
ncbi:MAG: glycosyltransferase [Mucilaginibacter sp.]